MMLKPSIDSLLEKVDSKYSLVILSSKRAHELEAGATPMLDEFESVKPVGQALEEIDSGDIIIDPNPELKRAMIEQRKKEQQMMQEQEKAALEEKIRRNH
ncbi:DNA-directed RNA polymerase subunit omega [Vagococcus humatus]|uniref:DNA-directed RNA polymerase subunit omega n=1 Tax=Vagococcus humatus TaxID=1889241 RepID=A0A3R9ZVS5_9ENTE|nr:DNA-directed RNA polymerase subunit omega [Vagococcus humatus]RST88910.1 DNA-directed RNA polymerase subunit omega [Vagococcus humatus]